MDSITKAQISEEQVFLMTQRAFGKKIILTKVEELTDGYFNTGYLVELIDGRKGVIKVAPGKDVKVMRYEKNLMAAEVAVLRKIKALGTVPVPEVIHYDTSDEVIENEYFVMEFLEGEPLNKVKDHLSDEQLIAISDTLGNYVKSTNDIRAQYFGNVIEQDSGYLTWSECFESMVWELLEDANDAGVKLPLTPETFVEMVSKNKELLDEVNEPSLVHKDLWEGNVFVDYDVDKGTAMITGIIDFERAIYGDPLMEIVCGLLEENGTFIKSFLGKDLINEPEMKRCSLYRVYLYLLIVVECPYRQYQDPGVEKWARGQLDGAIKSYKNLME